MHYEWHLEPRCGGIALHLIWNSETGELGGLGAARVKELITHYESEGWISTHPWPSAIPAKRIAHDPAQMAALLAHGWHLPAELVASYPQTEPSTEPTRADGIQTVY